MDIDNEFDLDTEHYEFLNDTFPPSASVVPETQFTAQAFASQPRTSPTSHRSAHSTHQVTQAHIEEVEEEDEELEEGRQQQPGEFNTAATTNAQAKNGAPERTEAAAGVAEDSFNPTEPVLN